jgi:hypothetical protein
MNWEVIQSIGIVGSVLISVFSACYTRRAAKAKEKGAEALKEQLKEVKKQNSLVLKVTATPTFESHRQTRGKAIKLDVHHINGPPTRVVTGQLHSEEDNDIDTSMIDCEPFDPVLPQGKKLEEAIVFWKSDIIETIQAQSEKISSIELSATIKTEDNNTFESENNIEVDLENEIIRDGEKSHEMI